MDQAVDLNALTNEDLQEEYLQLFKRFQQLCNASEADAQRIHELKRQLDTATAAESYLVQELEQLTAATSNQLQETHCKLQLEHEVLRKNYTRLQTEYSTIQQDYETLQNENASVRAGLEDATHKSICSPVVLQSAQQFEREQQLEQDNLELLQKLEEFQESTVRNTMAIAEREKNVEILRDQVKCIEENMRYKRDELEEITQLLESTQEQLMEANAKIAMLTAAPENNDRKGNSLFAEVDDQRQAMRQLLAAQKKSYMQMKKVFNESEHEIRRLKRENIAMHTELQACSSIFCNADKIYQEKLNERIRQLLNQNEEMERKLIWTQERLKEQAINKGVLWLDSMLNFCKQETTELQKQLHSTRIQKATLEEQLRNSQQEMARWRFESLKSRCVLMDRENLLTENKITFKPSIAMEFRISERQLQSAHPRIMSPSIASQATFTASQTIVKDETELKLIGNITDDNGTETATQNKAEILPNQNALENITLKAQQTDNANVLKTEENAPNINICNPIDALVESTEQDASSSIQQNYNKPIDCANLHETKENVADFNNVSHPIEAAAPVPSLKQDIGSLKKDLQMPGTLHLRDISELQATPYKTKEIPHSILCKKQDPFGKETNKSVKFCCKSIEPAATSKNVSDAKATIKKVRTKSNVVIRRVVVPSKHET